MLLCTRSSLRPSLGGSRVHHALTQNLTTSSALFDAAASATKRMSNEPAPTFDAEPSKPSGIPRTENWGEIPVSNNLSTRLIKRQAGFAGSSPIDELRSKDPAPPRLDIAPSHGQRDSAPPRPIWPSPAYWDSPPQRFSSRPSHGDKGSSRMYDREEATSRRGREDTYTTARRHWPESQRTRIQSTPGWMVPSLSDAYKTERNNRKTGEKSSIQSEDRDTPDHAKNARVQALQRKIAAKRYSEQMRAGPGGSANGQQPRIIRQGTAGPPPGLRRGNYNQRTRAGSQWPTISEDQLRSGSMADMEQEEDEDEDEEEYDEDEDAEGDEDGQDEEPPTLQFELPDCFSDLDALFCPTPIGSRAPTHIVGITTGFHDEIDADASADIELQGTDSPNPIPSNATPALEADDEQAIPVNADKELVVEANDVTASGPVSLGTTVTSIHPVNSLSGTTAAQAGSATVPFRPASTLRMTKSAILTQIGGDYSRYIPDKVPAFWDASTANHLEYAGFTLARQRDVTLRERHFALYLMAKATGVADTSTTTKKIAGK